MYILQHLQAQVAATSPMTNDEFLQFSIEQLQNIFHNEMLAIKNTQLNYVAFSRQFADEFELDETYLDTNKGNNLDQAALDANLAQEKQLLAENRYQDYLHFYKKNNQTKSCTMRKRPLINPFNSQVVGLVTVVSYLGPGFLRKLLTRKLFPKLATQNNNAANSLTTDAQQYIAFCLLAGFHSREEIALIINSSTNNSLGTIQIKNNLQNLYKKLDCNSNAQLLEIILNDLDNIRYPIDFQPNGTIYPIE